VGTWGAGVFENDAASDWLGHLKKLGFIAIPTPLSVIGEYAGRKKPIPADVEQSFWAMCEVVGIAGGLADPSQVKDCRATISREAERILKIPNLKRRILWALERLKGETTELEELWESAGEGEAFRLHRDRAKNAALEVLKQSE